MTPSKPPAMATWLLEHLLPGHENDALVGDLVEAFNYRRSTVWYWRQVLIAIMVRFSKEVLSQWVPVGWSVVWTIVVSMSWPHIKPSPRYQALLGWGVGHDWPQSLVYVMAIYLATEIAQVWAGLSVYLVITRNFDLRSYSRGLFVGSLIVVIHQACGIFFSGRGSTQRGHLPGMVLWLLPLFFALLLAMWTARANEEDRRVKQPGAFSVE